MNADAPRIYLAGPGVFRSDARAHGAHLKALCANAGLEGLYPLDNEMSGDTPFAVAQAIYAANVGLIDKADALVADISPFRGPNMDPGTAWEIGYAAAKRLPLFLYTSDTRTLLARTQATHALTPSSSGDGFVDSDNMSVEDFGLIENLMIAAPALHIHAHVEDAIAACVEHFSSQG
jgi:nucleoside 2-deoxyribosyltransferase